jgi:predicted anti-sigma-YlaC factor YlaD
MFIGCLKERSNIIMDCLRIKKLIPVYLDHALDTEEQRRVEAHLRICPDCRAEAHAVQKSWEMLAELQEIEPDPNYMARFWRGVEVQTAWYEKVIRAAQEVFVHRRWAPALAGAAVAVLVVTLVTVQYLQKPPAVMILAELNEVELEMVENIDLVENYDVIRDIEFFSDLEIIENLDEFETI